MKKFLAILVLSFLFSSNSNAAIEDTGYGKIFPFAKQGYEEAYSKEKKILKSYMKTT